MLLTFFWKKINGVQKSVIENKLNVYVPNNDNICKVSMDHDQVYETKFHGKPVNKFPLKNSKIANTTENSKTKKTLFSEKGPTIKIANPKKIDKNSGIIIKAKGIRCLNIVSCVKDMEIQ